MDAPQYVRLIADGKYGESLAVIREKTPLPTVLGNVCFHPCESKCRRGQLNEPISICALKRFAAEHDTGIWKQASQVTPSSDKRVAIIGSGPAGLTAAFYLAKAGHAVTIFEAASKPGGMMQVGIPRYRLPREVLQKDIDETLKLGVEIRTNTPVGNGLTIRDLKGQGYQAIFVAVGAKSSRKLKLEGADLSGVLWGMDFLRDVNTDREVKVKERVVVIGGGNVAIDVALTALRLGAKEVKLACLECSEEIPAHEWEVQEALDEGIEINPSWGPQRIISDNGKITGMEFLRCTSVFDSDGKFNPSFDACVTTTIPTDMVIMAIGQAPDLSFLKQGSDVDVTPGGTIKVDDNMETTEKGVFAGGEAVINPGSVVEAMAAGRKAAIAIDKYLGGKGVIDEDLITVERPNPWLGHEEGFADRSRVKMPCLPLAERDNDFSQIELGLGEELALAEAKRCLQCDLRFQISPVMLPPEKWLPFNALNIATVPEKDGVFQLLDEQKKVIYIVGAPNLRERLQEVLEQVAEEPSLEGARYFLYEEARMYTMRESELLQHYMKEHGTLPLCNSEIL
jgi:NADPH-dependent glutamate synthase beta subunit-like oxidoreductase